MMLVTLEERHVEARVLHITNAWPHPKYPRYGIFVKRQVGALNALGYHGDVLFIRGFLSPLAYPLSALVLSRLALKSRVSYEIVHCHGGETTPWARPFNRAPLVASYLGSDLLGHKNPDGDMSRRQRVRAQLVRASSRLADRTITVSEQLAARLPSSVRQRNSVIPDGVDLRVFVPIARELARAKLGWATGAPVVLFAASPTDAVKRFWLAELAHRQASLQIPGLQLRVIDEISPERMPVVMNAADCLLVTSSSEGSSNVVKEALACNLPVVSTEVGDARMLLAGVQPSFVCRADSEELAGALVRCLLTVGRSNGRDRAAEFDAVRVAERITRVYAEAYRSRSAVRPR